MNIFGLTDVGEVRERNEDAFGFDAARRIAVLADGMGGLNAGEIASRIAVDTTLAAYTHPASEEGLKAALGRANNEVFTFSSGSGSWRNMGTTLVACGCSAAEDEWVIGHVGDSRGYLLREGALTQITQDHSVVQEMVDQGLLRPEQARVAANRHVITRAIGLQAEVEVAVERVPRQPGDRVLLCSDGLSDMLEDTDILEIMEQPAGSLEITAQQLVAGANRRGGVDNITVVLISV